jgi:uncharacterized membrane protein
MLGLILFAFAMGIVAGLRTFTAPAAFFLTRGGIAGYILAVLAICEYIADALPKTPARTGLPAVSIRSLSGAITGWFIASIGGSTQGVVGAVAGVAGALVGTYGGYAGRMAAIAKFGAIPAAVVEDVIAIALAVLVMLQYAAFERTFNHLLTCLPSFAC